MLFPKDKMAHTTTFQGNRSDEGWLVLDIGNMELEGVNKIYISVKDIEVIRSRSKKQIDALEEAKRLLGGDIGE